MNTRSFTQQQLSRSKLELFLECPRCFYDDVVRGLGRPGSPAYSLNNAVDALLKAEFDVCRRSGTPHRLMRAAGLEFVPMAHPDLERWRTNFTGVRWTDPETAWTLYGAIDDLWATPTGSVVVADYKATARRDEVTAEQLYDSYKRKIEVYQFLIEKQGFTVESRAWFVYANGIAAGRLFDSVLSFQETLIPYDGNRGWVAGAFRSAVATATGAVRPSPGEGCPWCRYVEARAKEG